MKIIDREMFISGWRGIRSWKVQTVRFARRLLQFVIASGDNLFDDYFVWWLQQVNTLPPLLKFCCNNLQPLNSTSGQIIALACRIHAKKKLLTRTETLPHSHWLSSYAAAYDFNYCFYRLPLLIVSCFTGRVQTMSNRCIIFLVESINVVLLQNQIHNCFII